MESKMWTLIKKNAFVFVLLSGSLMALQTVYLLMFRKTLNTNIVVFLGQMLIYGVLTSLILSEKLEKKNNGYAFMNTLPIKDRDIVASKFAVVLAVATFLCVYCFSLISFIEGEAYLLPFGRIFLLLCGNLSLILAAGMYILVYRWGYTNFTKIAWIVVVVLMVGPFLFIEFVLLKRDIDYGTLLQSIINLPWFIWLFVTAITLVIFLGLLKAAIKTKEHQRGK
jgi:hypothetical protein